MTISQTESKFPIIPGAEGVEPTETPEEKLARLTEAMFDFKGHSTLYARFTGKDKRSNLALLQASKDESGWPVIEARIVRGNFGAIETELEDSVLEVDSLALTDETEEEKLLAPLYRQMAGAEDLDWVAASWVICVPLGHAANSEHKLRVSPPIEISQDTLESNAEEIAASRVALGAVAGQISRQ